MTITNDQYLGSSLLSKWYKKASHQYVEISGLVGTGIPQLIDEFLSEFELDPREVVYLSYDQKLVFELAYKQYHAYYLPGFLYEYTREVDFDTLSVLNPKSTSIEYEWTKKIKKKIDPKYKLLIVIDSTLMDYQTLKDLGTYGLPIILLRDPALMPSPDAYTYTREPNIILNELHPDLIKNPITYMANRALAGLYPDNGVYDTVSVIPKKQLNLYNLKSADMVITLSDELAAATNIIYRSKALNINSTMNTVNERVVCIDNLYAERLVNQDEKRVKLYLTKGLVGTLSKCNRHALSTRYVNVDFKPEFYHEAFVDLYMDRAVLNGIEMNSRQLVPEDVFRCRYAQALPVALARVNHWDKVTLIADQCTDDESIQRRMLYTAITRCKRQLTLVI